MVPDFITGRGTGIITIRDLLLMDLVFIIIRTPDGDFLPDLVMDGSPCHSTDMLIGDLVVTDMDIVMVTEGAIIMVIITVIVQDMRGEDTIPEMYINNVHPEFVQHLEIVFQRNRLINLPAHQTGQIMFTPTEMEISIKEIIAEIGINKTNGRQRVRNPGLHNPVQDHLSHHSAQIPIQVRGLHNHRRDQVRDRHNLAINYSAIIKTETGEITTIRITKEAGHLLPEHRLQDHQVAEEDKAGNA